LFRPGAPRVRLNAVDDPGLTYFLAFNGGEFMEVQPGQAFAVPGVQVVKAQSVDVAPDTGVLQHVLPATTYLETLQASQDGSTDLIRVAPGLVPSSRDARLVHKYIGVVDSTLTFISADITLEPGKTFTLQYTTGPALVSVQLKVQLTTFDRAITPVFQGATLEELS
jgi:hypothetical protein